MSTDQMNTENPITENDLHAYVDQRLDPARRAQVEAYLSEDAEAANRVLIYREQNNLLRAAFDPIITEPVPKYLLKRPVKSWHWPQWFAVAATLVMGTSIGWFSRGYLHSQPHYTLNALPSQAAVAHVVYSAEVLHPVEVGADQQDHLVKWLSKRLNTPLRAPVLSQSGYQLEGGRLLPGETGPAAQFMYRDPSGQRLTLYVRKDMHGNSDTAFRYSLDGDISTFYWVDGDMGYALSGALARERLLTVAEAVYKELMR